MLDSPRTHSQDSLKYDSGYSESNTSIQFQKSGEGYVQTYNEDGCSFPIPYDLPTSYFMDLVA